ncbi:putative chromatin remodeling & transcriptional activation HMG family [Rosa chinensis]|uniref:Putative chromatin remodeling & transcriptional activation HMG family n=1 Tax=Rosa chinensis TaxID=74649 RepID=A0A2P6R4T9_ROSCH|nr:high mobility group B protein 7 [Rosa chinensis]PRQ41457.1 putative chromatin remodeling & transcriptional activation HMG family [Rosa chinensis]
MGSGSIKSNPTRSRKRVEATAEDSAGPSLLRGKDGSAFARCDGCQKNVPVALISFHNCSLDAKIKTNLEAQVVEKPSEVTKKPPTERKKSSQPNAKRAKTDKVNKSKDPNAPKRPLTAFFLFMNDFRKAYKEANPDSKGVKMVAKEGGEKWNLMTDEEKKPYMDKAAELKDEYKKTLETEADDAEGEAEDVSEKQVPEKEVEEASEKEVEEASDGE